MWTAVGDAMPFGEWNFAHSGNQSEFREMLREYPGMPAKPHHGITPFPFSTHLPCLSCRLSRRLSLSLLSFGRLGRVCPRSPLKGSSAGSSINQSINLVIWHSVNHLEKIQCTDFLYRKLASRFHRRFEQKFKPELAPFRSAIEPHLITIWWVFLWLGSVWCRITSDQWFGVAAMEHLAKDAPSLPNSLKPWKNVVKHSNNQAISSLKVNKSIFKPRKRGQGLDYTSPLCGFYFF